MEVKDTLIAFGGAIKSLGTTETGAEKIGGYLVEFGTAETHDATPERDFFDKDTDFGIQDGAKTAVYYHHGLDKTMGKRKLGTGTLELKEAGVWFEAELQKRDAYEENILKMVKAGKLGLSSGTAHHLVERTAVKCSRGKAHHVDHWPLGLDASLTPTPANYRNSVSSLKSLMEEAEEVEPTDDADANIKNLLSLESSLPDGLDFTSHSAKTLAVVGELQERIESLADVRCVKSNRRWSEAKYAALIALSEGLVTSAGEIKAIAEAHAPEAAAVAPVDDSAEIEALEISMMEQEMRINDLLRPVAQASI